MSVRSSVVSSAAASSAGDSVVSAVSYVSGLSAASSAHSGATSSSKRDVDDETRLAKKLIKQLRSSGFFRKTALEFCQSQIFNNGMLLIIIINTVVMALQTVTSLNKLYGWYFSALDSVFLGIYLFECTFKLYCWRLQYFRIGWNCFDFFIVLTSLVTWIAPVVLTFVITINTKVFRLLRILRTVKALRSLRALRTISFLKSLQIIVTTLLKSVLAMGNILILMVLVMYIYAVIGTVTFRTIDPFRFGSLGSSFFYIFAVMTFDNWSYIYHDNRLVAPEIWAYAVTFIIIQGFMLLNLFVAVIVNNLQITQANAERGRKKKKKKLKKEEAMLLLDEQLMANDTKLAVDEEDREETALEFGELFEESSGIDNYYSPTLPTRMKELMANYFMLLTSLEHSFALYQRQQKILDDMVELVQEKSAETNLIPP
ncbi:hypothetical protein BJ742DRAFT_910759 [Cladochytrium replicatum]|nr:hypothetical protein BJ742DRAFT_910759 [Cladochytrium replicatum]